MSRKVQVTSWNECLEVLDGKHVVLDGIDGHIKVEWPQKSRFGGMTMTKVMHIKSAKGRKHPDYLEKKRQYKDHWDTDLSMSDDLGPIAERFCTFKHTVHRGSR